MFSKPPLLLPVRYSIEAFRPALSRPTVRNMKAPIGAEARQAGRSSEESYVLVTFFWI